MAATVFFKSMVDLRELSVHLVAAYVSTSNSSYQRCASRKTAGGRGVRHFCPLETWP
jgi:hypothetical protein